VINDVQRSEGNFSFQSVVFTFTVSLSAPSTQTITVDFSTADGGAQSGIDYVATSGTLKLAPGSVTGTIPVTVKGDTTVETSETFFVNLGRAVNAQIADGQGQGTILNDDIDINVGTSELHPVDSTIQVGQRTSLTLTWTHPVSWRELNTIDLRLEDADGVALWLRFDEAANAFSTCETGDACSAGFAPGSAGELQTDFATVFLKDSAVRGSGPTGPSVDLTFTFSLKSAAAGRVLHVEAAATDDAGKAQGFEETGTVTVDGTGSGSDGCSIGAHRGGTWLLLFPLALVWRRRRVRS
jgi:hypothetical protein